MNSRRKRYRWISAGTCSHRTSERPTNQICNNSRILVEEQKKMMLQTIEEYGQYLKDVLYPDWKASEEKLSEIRIKMAEVTADLRKVEEQMKGIPSIPFLVMDDATRRLNLVLDEVMHGR